MTTLDSFQFETVCASSGQFSCPGSFSEVHTESSVCHNCFRTNVSLVPGFDPAGSTAADWGIGVAIKQYLSSGNTCPAGFSSFTA